MLVVEELDDRLAGARRRDAERGPELLIGELTGHRVLAARHGPPIHIEVGAHGEGQDVERLAQLLVVHEGQQVRADEAGRRPHPGPEFLIGQLPLGEPIAADPVASGGAVAAHLEGRLADGRAVGRPGDPVGVGDRLVEEGQQVLRAGEEVGAADEGVGRGRHACPELRIIELIGQRGVAADPVAVRGAVGPHEEGGLADGPAVILRREGPQAVVVEEGQEVGAAGQGLGGRFHARPELRIVQLPLGELIAADPVAIRGAVGPHEEGAGVDGRGVGRGVEEGEQVGVAAESLGRRPHPGPEFLIGQLPLGEPIAADPVASGGAVAAHLEGRLADGRAVGRPGDPVGVGDRLVEEGQQVLRAGEEVGAADEGVGRGRHACPELRIIELIGQRGVAADPVAVRGAVGPHEEGGLADGPAVILRREGPQAVVVEEGQEVGAAGQGLGGRFHARPELRIVQLPLGELIAADPVAIRGAVGPHEEGAGVDGRGVGRSVEEGEQVGVAAESLGRRPHPGPELRIVQLPLGEPIAADPVAVRGALSPHHKCRLVNRRDVALRREEGREIRIAGDGLRRHLHALPELHIGQRIRRHLVPADPVAVGGAGRPDEVIDDPERIAHGGIVEQPQQIHPHEPRRGGHAGRVLGQGQPAGRRPGAVDRAILRLEGAHDVIDPLNRPVVGAIQQPPQVQTGQLGDLSERTQVLLLRNGRLAPPSAPVERVVVHEI